jgi:hypothetical protein
MQSELDRFQKEYKFREEQKNVIIQGFSAQQLEEMLYKSTKNVAYEVISCLIQLDNSGTGPSSLLTNSTQQAALNSSKLGQSGLGQNP